MYNEIKEFNEKSLIFLSAENNIISFQTFFNNLIQEYPNIQKLYQDYCVNKKIDIIEDDIKKDVLIMGFIKNINENEIDTIYSKYSKQISFLHIDKNKLLNKLSSYNKSKLLKFLSDRQEDCILEIEIKDEDGFRFLKVLNTKPLVLKIFSQKGGIKDSEFNLSIALPQKCNDNKINYSSFELFEFMLKQNFLLYYNNENVICEKLKSIFYNDDDYDVDRFILRIDRKYIYFGYYDPDEYNIIIGEDKNNMNYTVEVRDLYNGIFVYDYFNMQRMVSHKNIHNSELKLPENTDYKTAILEGKKLIRKYCSDFIFFDLLLRKNIYNNEIELTDKKKDISDTEILIKKIGSFFGQFNK